MYYLMLIKVEDENLKLKRTSPSWKFDAMWLC